MGSLPQGVAATASLQASDAPAQRRIPESYCDQAPALGRRAKNHVVTLAWSRQPSRTLPGRKSRSVGGHQCSSFVVAMVIAADYSQPAVVIRPGLRCQAPPRLQLADI